MSAETLHACSIHCKLIHRLLGQALIACPNGTLAGTEESGLLRAAVEAKAKALTELGVVDGEKMNHLLASKEGLAECEEKIEVTAGINGLLEELFRTKLWIDSAELESALASQKLHGGSLVQNLKMNESLLPRQENSLLEYVKDSGLNLVNPEKMVEESIYFAGNVTCDQLKRGLKKQRGLRRNIRKRITIGYGCADNQIAEILQHKFATAALLVTLPMTLAPILAQANQGASHAAPATARLNVSARVLAHTSMRPLHIERTTHIDKSDIERGFIIVKNAVVIKVKSNNPGGFVVAFDADGSDEEFYSEVVAMGEGEEVTLGSGGRWIHHGYEKGKNRVLSYDLRINLSHDAQPGTHALPFSVSVRTQ